MSEREIQISAAKHVSGKSEAIVGNHGAGIVYRDPNGTLYALKHSRYRFAEYNGYKSGDYTLADIIPVCYYIEPLPETGTSQKVTSRWLESLKQGELPEHATVGIEVEATCYNTSGELDTPYSDQFRPENHQHPELLASMLETATKKSDKGLPRTPVEVSVSLSSAVLDGYSIARQNKLLLAYASVAEAGSGKDAQLTPHPYLLSFAPLIVDFTLKHADSIPGEVIRAYNLAGVDILAQLQEGVLNWPINALHIHRGVPQIDGLADPRAAHAMGLMQLTQISKSASFILYNTRHLYGVDLGLKDVRSVIRRLLASSHNGVVPLDTETLLREAVQQLEEGKIHSLPRYPDTGQHDRMRLRMDGDKKTVESIDAPMTPDLRQVITWSCFNQIMDVVAFDALNEVGGDTAFVIPYLERKWGKLFSIIPTMGSNSCYEQDLSFNRDGFDTTSPLGGTVRDQLRFVKDIFRYYSQKYPAIQLHTDIVCRTIDMATSPPTGGDLAQYFGVENGFYQPNSLNRGLITDYKNLDPTELIYIQSEATRLQALALGHIRDGGDLKEFMGF